MNVGIIGAGAIGTIFGASLGRTHAVWMLVRDVTTAAAIRRRGGLVIGDSASANSDPTPATSDSAPAIGNSGDPTSATGDDTLVRVDVSHEPDILSDCEVVIVAVKAYATIDALTPLRDVLRRDAIVVSVQNGIDAAEQIETAFGRGRRIAVGPTTEAGRLVGAGDVIRASIGTTILGWSAKASGDRASLAAIARLLTASGLATRAVDDSTADLWVKLVVNAALNPITALARVTNGEVLERPELFARALAIAREVALLAAREGIVLPFADAAEHVRSVARATAANRSSMLQDVERGRPTEIDAILGAVMRRAHACGLAVPASQAAYDEVRRRANA